MSAIHVRIAFVVISGFGQLASVLYLGNSVSGGDALVYLRLTEDWLYFDRILSPAAFEANFWPAGYSGFLGLFHWAGDAQVVLVRLIHVLMAAVIALLAGRWIDTVNQRAGTIAVAVVAFSPTMVWAVWAIGYELLLAFLLALGLTLLWPRRVSGSLGVAGAGGLVLGIALVVQFRAVLAVIVLLVMLGRVNYRRAMTALVGVSVPLGLWSLRSLAATGRPFPWSANGPYNLWNGNNPLATGRNMVPIPALPASADSYTTAAFEWIRENPIDFVTLTSRKLMYLFEPTRIAGVSEPFPGDFLITIVEFTLAGFIVIMLLVFVIGRVTRRMPGLEVLDVLFMVSIAYMIPNVFFIVEARFAIPVHAMLVALSIGTLAVVLQTRGRLRPLGVNEMTPGKMSAATPTNGSTGNT